MSTVKDFWMFMKERKKFWLAPVIIVFLLLYKIIKLLEKYHIIG